MARRVENVTSVCFIILAYRNSVADLEEVFSALTAGAREAGVAWQRVLVSNDDSFDYHLLSDIEVHAGHGNVGFAAGIRIGVEAATTDYVVIANPDISISEKDAAAFISRLVAQRGVLLPVIRGSGGAVAHTSYEDWVFSAGRRYAAHVCRRFLLHGEAATLPRWVRICGAFVGMPTSIARHYGPFDDAFFMYGEDRDLTRRLRRDGIPIRLVRDVCVTHSGGGSSFAMGRELAICRADSGLRVAYRRYGKCGVWLKRIDLLLEAACRRGPARFAAQEGIRVAFAHWSRSAGEPPRLDFANVTGI